MKSSHVQIHGHKYTDKMSKRQKHSLFTNNSIINHIQIYLPRFYVTFVQLTIQTPCNM